jgi:hypothetical protein
MIHSFKQNMYYLMAERKNGKEPRIKLFCQHTEQKSCKLEEHKNLCHKNEPPRNINGTRYCYSKPTSSNSRTAPPTSACDMVWSDIFGNPHSCFAKSGGQNQPMSQTMGKWYVVPRCGLSLGDHNRRMAEKRDVHVVRLRPKIETDVNIRQRIM